MEWSDGGELDSVLQGPGCVGEGERFVGQMVLGQMVLEQMEMEPEPEELMAMEMVMCQEQKSL